VAPSHFLGIFERLFNIGNSNFFTVKTKLCYIGGEAIFGMPLIDICLTMRKVFSVPLLIALFFLFQAVMLPVRDYNTLHAEKKKIILQHADIIEGGEAAHGSFRAVTGNVVFRHDTLTLKCDSATDYGRENKIVLKGNVFFTDSSVEIYGDNGIYYPDRGVGELSGNVRGRMLDNSLAGKARRATLDRTASQIALYDDVLVWHDRQQISGEKILLHLKELGRSRKRRSIDEVAVQGNAFFAVQDSLAVSSGVYDQFSAKSMLLRLSDRSKITDISLESQAEILYHLYDEKLKPAGINSSSGDMIRMFFKEGLLRRVKVVGGVEGKQYPASFSGDGSINLSNFVWREMENPFKQQKSLP